MLPGGLGQTLPTLKDFEPASSLVTEDMVGQQIPCGSDHQRVLDQLGTFDDVGFDEVYVQQIGPEQEKFFDAWSDQLLPALRGAV